MDTPIDQSIQLWTKIQTIGAPLLAAVVLALAYWVTQLRIDALQAEKIKLENVEKAKSSIGGKLQFKKDGLDSGTGFKVLKLGNFGFVFDDGIMKAGVNLSDDHYADNKFLNGLYPLPIELRVEKDTLYISMTIKSFDGKIVGEIIDNEWRVNPNGYFKRNYDSHGFEVVDDRGIIKLNVDLFGKDIVMVNGIINRGGDFVVFAEREFGGTRILKKSFKERDLVKISNSLPNIFLYPADKHFGERNKYWEKKP